VARARSKHPALAAADAASSAAGAGSAAASTKSAATGGMARLTAGSDDLFDSSSTHHPSATHTLHSSACASSPSAAPAGAGFASWPLLALPASAAWHTWEQAQTRCARAVDWAAETWQQQQHPSQRLMSAAHALHACRQTLRSHSAQQRQPQSQQPSPQQSSLPPWRSTLQGLRVRIVCDEFDC